MAKDSYLALAIRNLPAGTTAQDVREHINRVASNPQPVVGPIVKDPNRPTFYTTVTIRQDSDDKCKTLRDKLNLTDFFPRAPETVVRDSKIAVHDEFLGVTTVAEHEDAQFDMYFIHGLGGHAYRSWSTDRNFPQMWPKDFFPNDVRQSPVNPRDPSGPKLAGRFSTVGYRASALNTWSATTTIEKAAENLINTIQTSRPAVGGPVFVNARLGGLVTCQALIDALRPDESKAEKQALYRGTFFQNGQCLVKGVFFFGTPFEGSKLANNASLIVKFLKGNTSLMDSLRIRSNDLTTIVAKFNQLRSDSETKIPILIAYEMQPMYGVKFVTEPESAISSFNVQTIGIDGDHRTMIKFPHNQDKSYREVSELMIRAIQSTLSESKDAFSSSYPSPQSNPPFSPSPLGRSQTTSTLPPYPGPPNPASSSQEAIPAPLSSSRTLPLRPAAFDTPTKSNLYHNNPFVNRTSDVTPVRFADIVEPTNTGKRENKNEFSLLSLFDTVFLLDDTASMGETDGEDGPSRWDQLVESLRYTVDIVCRYDKDGVDVHFLCNDSKDETNITEGQRILDLLTREVGPDEEGGGTYLSTQLHTILAIYMGRYTAWHKGRNQVPRPEKPKMLNLIIITDGEADDKDSVEDLIVASAKELDELKAHPTQVGIQFLQIGTDEGAAKWLRELDDSLKKRHGVRDMVDTRPWNNPREVNKSLRDRLSQILLGAISRAKDEASTIFD
ncbi:hypothetical protein OQA88_9352 [Cercophora sp. LCS_1]